ncbi:MAG TPA: hypothetical protein V6D12_12615 [Candidatus Obscuribacterales bacterium]
MQEVYGEKDALNSRISARVDNLIQSKSLFERLDKAEILKLLSTLVEENLSTEQVRAISDEELTRRIKKIMVLQTVAGTLNDLTPEQMEIFDAAVEGR